MPQLIIRDSVFEVLPPDIYVLAVKQVVENPGATTSYGPFYIWENEVVEPVEHAGKLYRYLTSTEFGPKSKSFKFALALGMTAPTEGEVLTFDTEDFIGREFVAEIGIEKARSGKYAGQDVNVLKNVWSTEEYTTLLSKMSKKTFSTPSTTVQTPPKQVSPPHILTKTINPPTKSIVSSVKSNVEKKTILEGTKGNSLADFPE